MVSNDAICQHWPLLSQLYLITKLVGCLSTDGISVYEVYKISREDTEAQVLEYGAWTEEKGLQVDPVHIWNRRADLKGKHLK